MLQVLVLVSVLTFLHYAAAQMRVPILPLYAAAHGATVTGVALRVLLEVLTALGAA